MQTFDEQGDLVTDVVYNDAKPFGEGGRVTLPSRIELSRPHDGYKLALTYQAPDEAIVDRQYEPAIFVLENKWQLPELDLDTKRP
jgi:hypothetical protein